MTEKKYITPHPDKVTSSGCISLIGMAAAGKTTIGRELAEIIGWEQLDADHLIESTYGGKLQAITELLTKDAFLDIEGIVIKQLNVKRMIISTGGSAVYRQEAMEHLASLGPVVYIAVPLPVILERIARKPERGLAIAPGQTIEDLYNERVALYEKFASFTVHGGTASAYSYALQIAQWLSEPVYV